MPLPNFLDLYPISTVGARMRPVVQAIAQFVASRGARDGIAALDSAGKVPVGQLPSLIPPDGSITTAKLADGAVTAAKTSFTGALPVGGIVTLGALAPLTLTDSSGSNFSRLNLGGVTSAFPALKRSGAAVHFRLADDSGLASIECRDIIAGGSAFDVNASTGNTRLFNNGQLMWSTNSISNSGTYDIGIGRSAAGVLEVNNGTPGSLRPVSCSAVNAGANGQVYGQYTNRGFTFYGSWVTLGVSAGFADVCLQITSAGPGIYAESASTIAIATAGGPTTYKSIRAATIRLNTYTVATLPTGSAGLRTFVSDATMTHAVAVGSIVAGGGVNFVPVYHDGTNWRIG